jgi:hypothetical protein
MPAPIVVAASDATLPRTLPVPVLVELALGLVTRSGVDCMANCSSDHETLSENAPLPARGADLGRCDSTTAVLSRKTSPPCSDSSAATGRIGRTIK